MATLTAGAQDATAMLGANGVEGLRALLTGAPVGDSAYLALSWCAAIALAGYLWARTAFGRGTR